MEWTANVWEIISFLWDQEKIRDELINLYIKTVDSNAAVNLPSVAYLCGIKYDFSASKSSDKLHKPMIF